MLFNGIFDNSPTVTNLFQLSLQDCWINMKKNFNQNINDSIFYPLSTSTIISFNLNWKATDPITKKMSGIKTGNEG